MVKSLKSKLNKSLKSGKLNVFLLFLVLSFMFLLLSKLNKEYTKTIVFKAQPIHAKENHVILDDSTHVFKVTLQTYGFKLIRYYLSKPTLQVDLNALHILDNHYVWTLSKGVSDINLQLGEDVKILSVHPESMDFPFDVNDIKTIPVNLTSNITFATGYDVSDMFILEPDSIKVIGPKVLISSIQSVQTQTLKLENINANIDTEVAIVLPDSSANIAYSHKTIKVTGQVEKFTEGEVEVPIDLINAPDHAQVIYFPKSVNVTYYTSLNNYKAVNKSDFIVECNFNDLDSNATYLQAKLVKYPDFVKNVRLIQKQIDFIITK